MAARTRTKEVTLGAALAGLLIAGCANPSTLDRTASPEDSLARVQGAAARVTEAKSSRFSMTVRTIFAGEQVAAATATTVGSYDYAAHKGQMDTTVKTAGIPFRSTLRTLVIGSTIYMKMPEPPAAPAGAYPAPPEEHHKPWVKLDLPKELAGRDGFGPGFGPGLGDGSSDPTEALEYLKAASRTVKVVGQERVRGVLSTRYAVTLDAAKVEQAAQLPEELSGMVEESDLAFAKPADVWIDQQGRLTKMQYAVTMKVPEAGSSARMTLQTTLELYDFGVEVHVTPPAASQVEAIAPDGAPPGWPSAEHSGATSP